MKKQSPAQKRQETLKVFFTYCCETYKNKLTNDDEFLRQVYNIIAEMHGEGYMLIFYNNSNVSIREKITEIYGKAHADGKAHAKALLSRGGITKINLVYLQVLKDFCENKPIKGMVSRNWKIRQASNKIIKLINQKL